MRSPRCNWEVLKQEKQKKNKYTQTQLQLGLKTVFSEIYFNNLFKLEQASGDNLQRVYYNVSYRLASKMRGII